VADLVAFIYLAPYVTAAFNPAIQRHVATVCDYALDGRLKGVDDVKSSAIGRRATAA
jgi:hypothetical protein